MFLLIK